MAISIATMPCNLDFCLSRILVPDGEGVCMARNWGVELVLPGGLVILRCYGLRIEAKNSSRQPRHCPRERPW